MRLTIADKPLPCMAALVLCWLLSAIATAAEWQWSVAEGQARAYLWIPPQCERVRGLVLANHNMIEQGILEHQVFRQTLTGLDFAEVWVVPYLDATFDFNQGAGEHFERVVADLAAVSGYSELATAPVVPLGHSACATFPWNFAAWNPGRTLAVLSVHGDAPRTTLTGNGKPRIAWGERSIDGVPGLMVMGEYEWWEDRIAPAFAFQAEHPRVPLAFLADAGHGHFDYSDELVAFLAQFIATAAAQRLPADDRSALVPIDPQAGWRIDRWHRDAAPTAVAAPAGAYAGERSTSFWCFDRAQAEAIEAMAAAARGKLPQLISVTAPGDDPQSGCGEPVTPRLVAEANGVTFRLHTAFMSAVPGDAHNANPARWAGVPVGTPLGHATDGGPIRLSRIVGPAIQTGDDSFAISLGRAEYTENHRNRDIWLLASHPGDAHYKSAVQQVRMRLPDTAGGRPQVISFPAIADQRVGIRELPLQATSDAGSQVCFYVREGPAEIDGTTVRFTALPPRSRFPVAVTIVAWQLGRASAPRLQAAVPVEQTFHLTL